ncbi:unnamed protein product [Urochloa decumbens]|uniref:Knottins-like domain-containing protein n=1 Tax=Urochloa decumbens TaxID=240449 RepID=A0ABC9HBP6_9POAL
MESSRRTAFASVAILLIVVVMATGIMHVQADSKYCYHPSRHFKGWCSHSSSCWNVCVDEAPYNNIGGECRGFLPARCWCKALCTPPPPRKVVAGNSHATGAMGPVVHE